MNLYITENIDKSIEGFEIAPILYGKVDLNVIPNNAAQTIVAIDALDSISYDFVEKFIENIRQKMRIGCKLSLGGTNLNTIAKHIINGSMTTNDFNNIIYSKKSIYNVNEIVDLLTKYSITIEGVKFNGINYEISAYRQS